MDGFFASPRTILLISPQPWNAPPVSKHHYARLLGEQGHRVFFVEPPDLSVRGSEVSITPSGTPGVEILRYRLPFPYGLKFRLRGLFKWLMRSVPRRIARAVGAPIDLVWDFDNNYMFDDLRRFPAARHIFHPVDDLHPGWSSTKHAPLVLANNQFYMDALDAAPGRRHLIPHGTQEAYVGLAERLLASGFPSYRDTPLTVGYVGNLDRKDMDWDALHAVVDGHPDLHFRIIGPYGQEPPSIPQTERLRTRANVSLLGRRTPEEVIEGTDDIDIWFVAYRYPEDSGLIYPHKINEFLATGKPILASRLSYPFPEGAIRFSQFHDNRDVAELLAEMRRDYPGIGRPLAEARARFAMENSYDVHIATISRLLLTPEGAE
jgi:glycosyltransferase involved in cell wall biosynthesis